MLLQQIVTGLIVIGALAYLGRGLYRSFRSEKECAGVCKCDSVKQVSAK